MSYIKLVRKNKALATYIDDEYMGVVYRSDLEKLGIDKKAVKDEYESEIDDIRVETLRDIVIYHAFDKAVSIGAAVECCAYDISFKLKRREVPQYAIDGAIDLMYEYNYINDERYAESYIRSYIGVKSRSLIEKELSMKHILVDDLSELFESVYADENVSEEDTIQTLMEKKFKNQDLSDEKVKRRAMNMLIRHGFSFSQINNYLHDGQQ